MKLATKFFNDHRLFCQWLEGGWQQYITLNLQNKVTDVVLYDSSGYRVGMLTEMDGVLHYYRLLQDDDNDWVWKICTDEFFSSEVLLLLNEPFKKKPEIEV